MHAFYETQLHKWIYNEPLNGLISCKFGAISNPPEVLLLLPARKTQLKLGSKRDERKKCTNPHTSVEENNAEP
ncbi:unnamed protein product [Brugia pahangi]|uniref:Ovule protein n=1 Tax=Brugia pahangi TaxID=6280 RepID=A0A0N4TRI9_BRUPA|nr:unnamed protein product [Brugia pahangi]